MIRPEFRKTLLDQQTAVVVLWGFFAVSILLYIVIAHFVLAARGAPLGPAAARATRWIIWALVLVDAVYLLWWRRRRLTRAALADSAKTKILRALEEHRTPREREAALVVSTYVTRKVVGFAIIEAIAVYGLMAGLIGGFLEDQYLLSALSLVLLGVEFPTKSALETLVADIEAGTWP
ncbi:MAG TPA: hypothetical protein VNN77_19400 [candidate division Zixibacteria bacterium]|nr:hypothetical protein [candidate division Zixibacteria bacterium]